MALGPKMCMFFNLSYLFIFLCILYLSYLNVQNGGIYPGDFPEGEGSELLEFYSSHPLHGFMNILINFISIIVFFLYVHLTIDPEFRKEPAKIHLLNFSNILFLIPVMLYAQEWLTAERTSVRT